MQVKPLLLTIAILGGLAYLADHLMLDKPVSLQTVNQNIIALPLPTATVDTLAIKAPVLLPSEQITLGDTQLEQGIQDLIVRANIEKRLFKAKLLPFGKVQIVVSNGEVTLKGHVTAEEDKRQILNLVRRTMGAQAVIDKLEVK